MKKPAGFARITRHSRAAVLGRLPLVEVWNIGPSTAGLLQAHGLQTALDFANKSLGFVESVLTKPGVEVWHELKGESVWSVQTEAEQAARSISKTRTFTPPTADRDYVYAQLAKNMENACIKARRYRQAPKMVAIFLKRQDYRAFGLEAKLVRPTAWPAEMAGVVRELFEKVFEEGVKYRATGCILAELTQFEAVQMGLFESKDRIAKLRRLYGAVDEIRERYGKHAVHHAASLLAQGTQHLAARGDVPRRRVELVAGESARRRLPLPMIHTNHT